MKNLNGKVVWFDNKSGYGFIERIGEKDLFVHFSDINCEGFKTINKGDLVSFEIGKNHSGEPKAINVTKILE